MKYKSPVYNVIAVPIEKVRPNNYNPNKVAPPEMRLLMKALKRTGIQCRSYAITRKHRTFI